MAECNPIGKSSLGEEDPVEICINEKFDFLVECINRRRDVLISEFRMRQEDIFSESTRRRQTLQSLNESKANLAGIKDNMLQSFREKMSCDLDDKIKQLEVKPKEFELECDTQQLEDSIASLGQLIEREVIAIPKYSALSQPTLSFGKEGTEESNLKLPRSLAYDEKTKLIYVVNSNQITACIKSFSVTGEYRDTFCTSMFDCPIGIALKGEQVYVSDCLQHSIFHLKLPDFKLLGKVGKEGTGKGEFSFPQKLTIAPNGSVLIADSDNHRVVVMDPKLNYKRSIKHESMRQPVDVKLLRDRIYILSYTDNLCLHEFTQSGKKIRSFITCGEKDTDLVREVYSFCFDRQNNILVGDQSAERILVFSLEGNLLHKLGCLQDKEKEKDRRIKPRGIVITNDNDIICTSYKTLFGLHVFF